MRFWVSVKKYTYIIIILFAITALVLVYFSTPIFQISQTNIIANSVSGLTYTNKEDMLAYLKKYRGVKYLSLNPVNVRDDILKEFKYVKDVFITKELPGIMNVFVTERFPFTLFEVDSKCLLIDQDLYVIKEYQGNCSAVSLPFKTIYVKTDDKKVIYSEGQNINYYQLSSIYNIVKVLNHYKIGVEKVEIIDNVGTFNIGGDRQYIFSFMQDINEQLARFISVISEVESKSLKYKKIDFRFKRPVLTTK